MPESGLRILLVEDDFDICSLFQAGLMMRGHTVEITSNGHEALALLATTPLLPSVIVADLHMPIMNGWEFLTALSADSRLASIPIIVLTAADDPTKHPRPPKILIKPVSMDVLEAALKAAARSPK